MQLAQIHANNGAPMINFDSLAPNNTHNHNLRRGLTIFENKGLVDTWAYFEQVDCKEIWLLEYCGLEGLWWSH